MNLQSKMSPVDYSTYARTGNNAIDLIAQSIGFHKAAHKPLRAIYLSRGKWLLFVEGMKILQATKGSYPDPHSEYTFEGVSIQEGSRMQIDDMRYEYRKGVQGN